MQEDKKCSTGLLLTIIYCYVIYAWGICPPILWNYLLWYKYLYAINRFSQSKAVKATEDLWDCVI